MTPEPQPHTYARGLYNHRCVYCPPLSDLKGTMVKIFRPEGLEVAATDEEVVDVELVVREVDDVTEGAVVELDEID